MSKINYFFLFVIIIIYNFMHNEHKDELNAIITTDVEKRHRNEFPKWFERHVCTLKIEAFCSYLFLFM